MKKIRHVIIHYHIFKNAGSTIDVILKKNFQSGWGAIEGKPMTYRLDNEDLLKYILENPQLVAISSHEARPPAPVDSRIVFHPILFIRHPIDRIGSIYSYRRSQPEITTHSSKIARETDMAGFIKWCLANPSGETISNFQTTFLSRTEKNAYNMPNLEIALQRVRELSFVGLVESFDVSMLQLQKYLYSAFGKLDLSYMVANKSIDREDTMQERLNNIKLVLGPSLYQELIEKNSLDFELFSFASKIFKKRVVSKRDH